MAGLVPVGRAGVVDNAGDIAVFVVAVGVVQPRDAAAAITDADRQATAVEGLAVDQAVAVGEAGHAAVGVIGGAAGVAVDLAKSPIRGNVPARRLAAGRTNGAGCEGSHDGGSLSRKMTRRDKAACGQGVKSKY